MINLKINLGNIKKLLLKNKFIILFLIILILIIIFLYYDFINIFIDKESTTDFVTLIKNMAVKNKDNPSLYFK